MSTKKYKIITVESFYFTFLYFAPNYGSIYQSIDKWCERVGETWSGTTGGCCLGLRSCVAACLLIGPLGPRWGGLGVCGAQSRWWPLTPPSSAGDLRKGKKNRGTSGLRAAARQDCRSLEAFRFSLLPDWKSVTTSRSSVLSHIWIFLHKLQRPTDRVIIEV